MTDGMTRFQFLNGAIRISLYKSYRAIISHFNSSMVRLEYKYQGKPKGGSGLFQFLNGAIRMADYSRAWIGKS